MSVLSDTFAKAAVANNGKFGKLGQSRLIKHLPPNSPSRGGICRALCLAHSGLRAQGSDIKQAQSGEEMYKEAVATYASKIQEDVSEKDNADTIAKTFQKVYQRQAGLVGLKMVGPMETINWPSTDKIVGLATDYPYRCQIALPTHVICIQEVGSKYEIYDPNVGILRVPKENVKGAFGYIYTHPEIMSLYNLANNVPIYVACLR